ncbi:hypothetical protein HDF13_003786 [Edaphobacter lichenicola]|uniref:Uncharacterized protein n=1 Tax=Tunturiibacter gelidiferens TaxID=3069689 RepID=A0ACC5P3N6_9BACT|nr:hypothetical protein [Edaphobacter lichenicola]
MRLSEPKEKWLLVDNVEDPAFELSEGDGAIELFARSANYQPYSVTVQTKDGK